ncbi:hypothetical protein VNI00_005802 [Paramarasmius palmivorus]|uniref:Uncharacterized protein n=1 Tax=Paramarasmius palmivorus TaxID=297713 RepID=A0AAW0DGS0_9AGAR
MRLSLYGIPEPLQDLFGVRTTRSGNLYSPYLTTTNACLDRLIYDSITRDCPDPLGSPLTTPPSSPSVSRSPSPEPHISVAGFEPTVAPTPIPEPATATSLPQPISESYASTSRPKRKKRPQDQKHSHSNRAKKRKLRLILLCSNERALSQCSPDPRIFELAVPTKELNPALLPPAASGYVAKSGTLPEAHTYRLEDLVHGGPESFELVKFLPGATRYVPCRETGKIIVIIAPGPHGDPTWGTCCKEAAEVLRSLRPRCRFRPHNNGKSRSRGDISALHYGISVGNGQKKPQVLSDLGVNNRKVMDQIRLHKSFQRIVGFMTSVFLAWAPHLFFYYVQIMGLLLSSDERLYRPFDNSPFACFTVNFGPRTVCLPHRDTKNLAFGWCAICALGEFDYTKGGHLVLWEMKLVIEFPPGAIIFIPSAVCCHFNTAIQDGEERFSFTTYSSGGLFRWVEHGFQLEGAYQKTEQAVRDAQQKDSRWVRGLNLFLTLDELQTGSVKFTT